MYKKSEFTRAFTQTLYCHIIIGEQQYTVKLQNKGHIGDGPVVPCREVVLFSEVFSQIYWKVF